MERQKRPRDKKIRVNITISESVYNEYGLYIDNLSGFINKTLKNYISRAKELENSQKATNEIGTDNNRLCYDNEKDNKKRLNQIEHIEEQIKSLQSKQDQLKRRQRIAEEDVDPSCKWW